MDFIVIKSAMGGGFTVERHHDKPADWDGKSHPEAGLTSGRQIAKIPLDSPALQARTLDEWREYILRTTRELRADRRGG